MVRVEAVSGKADGCGAEWNRGKWKPPPSDNMHIHMHIHTHTHIDWHPGMAVLCRVRLPCMSAAEDCMCMGAALNRAM